MPTYNFQCNVCGLRFEASAKLTDYKTPKPCTACGKPAERLVPTDVHGVFEQPATGPVPQNTGVSEFDTHVDRVIGKSAEQGWEAHAERYEEKLGVMTRTGASGYDLSKTLDGGWKVMKPGERRAVETARAINNRVMGTLIQQKRSSQEAPSVNR